MTSQPIRLSTNFMTLIPSLTFTDYEWFPWSICNGCGMPAGNAYPSGHLVPSPILDLLMLQLLRPNSSNLPCLFSTFHLEYPLVLSRFCLQEKYKIFPEICEKVSKIHCFFPKMKVLFLTNCQYIHFMDVSVNKMSNHNSFTVE